jgi:hypothetical protein
MSVKARRSLGDCYPAAMSPKYAPLTASLAAQLPGTVSVTLTFAAIEALIRAPLPPSAYTTGRYWWSNAPRNPRARAWRPAGWVVAAVRRGRSVDARQWAVTFTRTPSDTIGPPP